jgi:hypothetical protein
VLTSASLAASVNADRGVPFPSTMIMTFVPFPFFVLPTPSPPDFAGENVPSPIASSQRMPLSESSFPSSRFQAAANAPVRVHLLNRRQHVEGDGYRSGNSCHWEPVRRIQRIPSRQGRGSTGGRPPLGEAGGLASRSAIRSHCSSVINGLGGVRDPVRFDRRRAGHIATVISMQVTPFTRTGMQIACQALFSF